MKNKPITERVNAGLFKQKQLKTTEPLLNVGPAGVRGNNKTRNIPSPAKQNDDTKVGVTTTKTSVAAGELLKGKEKTRTKLYSDLDPSERKAAKAWNLKKYGTHNPTKEIEGVDNSIGTGEFEPDTQGPDVETTTKDFVATRKRESGSALAPWEIRQQSRGLKKSAKDIRQNANKIDKANSRMKGLDENSSKYKRLKNKVDSLTTLGEGFDSNMAVRNRQAEVSANHATNDKFKGPGSDEGLEDLSRAEQVKIIEDGNYKKEGVGTSPTSQVTTKTTDTTNVDAGAVTKDVDAVVEKSTPNFFKKKSPIKMKYFK